jgi:hypothetical protein
VRRGGRLLEFSLGCWPVSIATTVTIKRTGMGSRPRSRRDSFQIGTPKRSASAACGIPEARRCRRIPEAAPRLREGRCGRHSESLERLLRSSI